MDINIRKTLAPLPVLAARVLGSPIVMVKFKDGNGALLDTQTRRLIEHPDISYTNEEVSRILSTSR